MELVVREGSAELDAFLSFSSFQFSAFHYNFAQKKSERITTKVFSNASTHIFYMGRLENTSLLSNRLIENLYGHVIQIFLREVVIREKKKKEKTSAPQIY